MSIWNSRNWKPMLLKEVDKPFNSKDYIFELKYDGIRTLCFVNKNKINFISRNNNDLTKLFPELESIKNIVNGNVIFDGEIVSFEKDVPKFSKIQERLHLKDDNKIKIHSKRNPVVFVVFDILFENKDLTDKSLMERKEILSKYKDNDNFVVTKYVDSEGIKLFNFVKKKNLEGIVAKLKTSIYHINKRTDDFIKIKNIKRDEFYIGGYKENKINISVYLCMKENNKYNFVGKCSVNKKSEVFNKLKKEKNTKNHFRNLKREDINYVKPTILCDIEYTEVTKNGNLRHPIFKGVHNEI